MNITAKRYQVGAYLLLFVSISFSALLVTVCA